VAYLTTLWIAQIASYSKSGHETSLLSVRTDCCNVAGPETGTGSTLSLGQVKGNHAVMVRERKISISVRTYESSFEHLPKPRRRASERRVL
jgi:hypothetical protein